MKVSILVQTVEPWPAAKIALDKILLQAELGADCELILTDSNKITERVPKKYLEQFPNYKHIISDTKSIMHLRSLGINNSAGEIIAITEDHCEINNNWISNIKKALEENPKIDVIGGNVRNGSAESCFDRANYWWTFNRYVEITHTKNLAPCIANVAMKREVVNHLNIDAGVLEKSLNVYSIKNNSTIFINNPVTHVQSHGKLGTLAVHFHNARTCVGLVKNSYTFKSYIKKIAKIIAFLPYSLLFGTNNLIKNRKVSPLFFHKDYPIFILILFSHWIGEVVGLIWGEGNSPSKIV